MDRHFNMKSTMPYNTLDEKIYLAYNKDVELQGRRPYTYLRGSSWRHRNAERLERFLASRFGRTSTSVKLVAILLTLVFMNLVYLLASSRVTLRSAIPCPALPALIRSFHPDGCTNEPSEGTEAPFLDGYSFPETFGKDLLILDVDNRPETLKHPDHLSDLTWGRVNHQLYAQAHGYDYKYMRAEDLPDYTPNSWFRVPAIRKMLQTSHKYIVFIDSDAVFAYPKISMEWLLHHWTLTNDTAITLGFAEPDKSTYDRTHRRQGASTGFMVVQNTPAAHRMFRDWEECPTETRYKGCAMWGTDAVHEQDAFSDYIRYEYANVTRQISCDEVDGAPPREAGAVEHCAGTFIRHS